MSDLPASQAAEPGRVPQLPPVHQWLSALPCLGDWSCLTSTQLCAPLPHSGAACSGGHCAADCCYNPGLLERSVELARQAGCQVALDLASFEVIRRSVQRRN